MECFIKSVIAGKPDDYSHKYFVRFGKGVYRRRFIINIDNNKKIKIKTSFEFANDLTLFVDSLMPCKFSGKILMKEPVAGKPGKKKAGVFVYEVNESGIGEYNDAYYYLLDCVADGIVLKMKKALPKPGKDAEKIDDKFCSLELDLKYLEAAKNAFFWDIPSGKKIKIEHTLNINEIVFPKDEKDPVKIRALAKRKGVIDRNINIDGIAEVKNFPFEA